MADFIWFSAEYNHYILQTVGKKIKQKINDGNECLILLLAKS